MQNQAKLKTILITGATAGIGKATALRFAREQHRLILTGRRKDKLEHLAGEIAANYQAEVLLLSFDVSNRKTTEKALGSIPEDWQNIDILINNAGLAAGLDPVHEASLDDWDTMIDTNIRGLLYVSRMIIPMMIRRERGHIFNIGSIAGKEVYHRGSVYAATKHAVDALTKGMRIDLLAHGIKVTQIAARVYQGYEPLQGEDIAEIIHFISTLPPRVNVNDILVMPQAQANATTFHKI
jgi:NADP-dependent 3-hydroxy acid dehydrogenase YdfG